VGRRARATVAMARRHRAQAVATATGPAVALSWAREDLAGWAASWAARKQREGDWNGGAGRAGLGDQPGFGPFRIGVRKILFFFKSFYNLQTNLNSLQIQILMTSIHKIKYKSTSPPKENYASA
jgi:hypothetical protein